MLQNSTSIDELYGALVAAGKCGYVELRAVVEPLLAHRSPDIRAGAIQALAFFWKVPDYREKVFAFYENDPDPEVQGWALTAWAGYRECSHDREALHTLWSILRDLSKTIEARDSAYRGILAITCVPAPAWKLVYPNIDSIDWDKIRALLRAAGAIAE